MMRMSDLDFQDVVDEHMISPSNACRVLRNGARAARSRRSAGVRRPFKHRMMMLTSTTQSLRSLRRLRDHAPTPPKLELSARLKKTTIKHQ
jgi:hypothetical protein